MLSGGEGPRLKDPGGDRIFLFPGEDDSSPPPLEESSLCLSCPIAFAIGLLLLNFSNFSLALTLSLTAFQTVERPEGLDSDVAGLVLREVGLPEEAEEVTAPPEEGSLSDENDAPPPPPNPSP